MKQTRVMSLLLMLVMVMAFFAACGEETTTAATTEGTTTEASGTSGTEGTESEKPQLNENGEYDVELPLVDEMVTITMWGRSPDSTSGMNNASESVARQEMEKRTNVHIEWTHATTGQESVQFNLMMASQTYTDAIIAQATYYIGGFDKYIDDGTIIDLVPYTDYMQNYMMRRQAVAEEGGTRCIGYMNTTYATNSCVSITTAMDESLIPVFCQYQDYLYTDEGATLSN